MSDNSTQPDLRPYSRMASTSPSTRRSASPPRHAAHMLHREQLPPPLQHSLSQLAQRLSTFETRLSSAATTEADFRVWIQARTNDLDNLIMRHVDDDRLLARLIAEDTQRSRDAKHECDSLASKLNHHVRTPSPTRVRHVLSAVSNYVGIVLSLVFMAPLHALWALIARRVNTSPNVPVNTSPPRRTRGRDEPRLSLDIAQRSETPSPIRLSGSSLVNTTKTSVTAMNESTPYAPTTSADSERESQEDFVDALDAAPKTPEPESPAPSAGTVPASINEGGTLEETQESEAVVQTHQSTTSDTLSAEAEDESIVDEGGVRRPGWAMPSGGFGKATFEMATFPSSDFWEISEDEMRLEALRESRTDGGT